MGHKFGVFAPGMSVSRPELVPQVVRAPEMTSLLETATGRRGEKARPEKRGRGRRGQGVNAAAEKNGRGVRGEAGGKAGRRGSAPAK